MKTTDQARSEAVGEADLLPFSLHVLPSEVCVPLVSIHNDSTGSAQ